MSTRYPCATTFYREASPSTIRRYVEGFEPPALSGPVLGGIVPHAGWTYSGRTAARVFFTLKHAGLSPETFVFFGAVHRAALTTPAVDTSTTWTTPFGEVQIDLELAEELKEAGVELWADPAAHRGEHSIEVAVPFLQYFFPDSRLLPILCPPVEAAARFGASVGGFLKGRPIAVMASTDLTHYGAGYGFAPAGARAADALDFMKRNDDRMIELIRSLDAEAIVPEAKRSLNACGSGAVAAATAAARRLGARRAVLVEYTTSYHAFPEDPVTHCVGYAGMVFEGPPDM